MEAETAKIENYKVKSHFDDKNKVIIYGIDVFINNEWLGLMSGKKAVFFDTIKEANKYIREQKKK